MSRLRLVPEPVDVEHFKCRADGNHHHAWCDACTWDAMDTGSGAAARIRRKVVRHVKETGHEVRIDVTRQHGYRARPVKGGA